MSFNVNWSSLGSESLSNWTRELLTDALNSGKRPNILASDIQVKDMKFGEIGPRFEILEIGELDRDRFRGIFKINYDGDFDLTLHTDVQANPMNIYSRNFSEGELDEQEEGNNFITPKFVGSDEPFALPLDLRLSDIKISGIGIIVFSASKGLTLVFRNEPLDSIKVSSTFDTVQVLANYLQAQIENQIRDLFRETLPTLIHQLSLKYISVNGSDFSDLHTQLKNKMNNSETEAADKVSIKDINGNFTYASANLQKNILMFSSRETLSLNVPRFKNTIHRAHMEKYTMDWPNLFNSLKSKLKLQDLPINSFYYSHNNGIPIDILSADNDKDIHRYSPKVEQILNEISYIQSMNYHHNSNAVRPRRRVIKLRKGSKKSREQDANANSSSLTTIGEDNHLSSASILDISNTSDNLLPSSPDSSDSLDLDISQPKPVKLLHALTQDLRKPASRSSSQDSLVNTWSPSHSNSFLWNGVGLGTNCIDFTSNRHISTSPVKSYNDQEASHKKSMNYIDIKSIKDKDAYFQHDNFPDTQDGDRDIIPGSPDIACDEFSYDTHPPPPYQL